MALPACYARSKEREQQQELIRMSYDYEKEANAQLDRFVEQYQPTKDCECITHEGSCWINHHRYWITKNCGYLRNGSYLAQSTFEKEEHYRLQDVRAIRRLPLGKTPIST